ncbi:hypothetical protein E4U51_003053 [Claviceps purpurea]|nr:hypothetical protein E4U51_003053 [Claviceps purpurea]
MEFQRKLKLEADNAEAPRASWVLVQLEIEVNEDGTMIAVPDHVVDPYASNGEVKDYATSKTKILAERMAGTAQG